MTTDEWRASVNKSLQDVNERLTELEKQDAVDEVHRQNVEQRLAGIESSLVWIVRLIIGALIIAVIGFALGGGLVLP